jgi:excisionase family DNA binding protein
LQGLSRWTHGDGAEFTTQQAADFLNVSRPFLVGLLEQKKLPFRLVGTHRRIRFEDVLRFKENIDAERRKVLSACRGGAGAEDGILRVGQCHRFPRRVGSLSGAASRSSIGIGGSAHAAQGKEALDRSRRNNRQLSRDGPHARALAASPARQQPGALTPKLRPPEQSKE